MPPCIIHITSQQTVSGVSITDLSYNGALAAFQTGIMRAVANTLDFPKTGGSISVPEVTASQRRLEEEEQGLVGATIAIIRRQLLQSGGVNAKYSGTYIALLCPPFKCIFFLSLLLYLPSPFSFSLTVYHLHDCLVQ